MQAAAIVDTNEKLFCQLDARYMFAHNVIGNGRPVQVHRFQHHIITDFLNATWLGVGADVLLLCAYKSRVDGQLCIALETIALVVTMVCTP